MRFIEEQTIQEYVYFLRQHYHFDNLNLCVVEANEREWKMLYTAIRRGARELERALNEGEIEEFNEHNVGESHRTEGEYESYENRMGYYIPTGNLLWIIDFWKDSDFTKAFKKKLDGTEFFIMLRKAYPYLRTRGGYLDTLFHEILHAIEFKSQKRIFRGGTVQQEARDTVEIVVPLVKLFMKESMRPF